ENPVLGRKLTQGEECAVVESVKAASDVYAPIAGEVIAANADVEGAPEAINQDAYAAWMFKLKPDNAADLDGLLDAAAYQAIVDSEAH
ncbi:MAG: glycine cleavage system protein H, partial [Sulfuricella sp.]